MYAWFRDRATANQFVQFVESLQSCRHLRPEAIDHLAATHALALGGVILFHPKQRWDAGYAVPLRGTPPRVMAYKLRPWWRRLLHQVLLTLLVAAVIWIVGAFIWFVERGLAL